MRREKEVWLEPIDGEDVWFEIRWQFAGVPRVICQASLYDRNNHEEDHYLVNVRKTWAEQGCNPMNVRFNLLVEHAEGYEFERSRGGKWHAAHASIENGQKRINGLPKFRVTDRNSGYKCEIAVFTYPTRDIPDVFSTMPSLHQKPCDNYRGELTPIPDVYSLSNPKDTAERHRFERTAFTGGAHNYLTPWTSHHRWRLVSAWARHCGDRTTNLIATRNVGWLFTKHFDAGGLQEHPKLHSVWPVIRRAISLYLADPKRATMTEALTDEEIDSLQLLSSDWFEFLVGSNVDFEKQIFRETAACFEIDWWLRLSWEMLERAWEVESPDELFGIVLDGILRSRLSNVLTFEELIVDLGGYEPPRAWTLDEAQQFLDKLYWHEPSEDDEPDMGYLAYMFSLAERSIEICEAETLSWIYAEQTLLYEIEEAAALDCDSAGFSSSGPNLHTDCGGDGPISLLPFRWTDPLSTIIKDYRELVETQEPPLAEG